MTLGKNLYGLQEARPPERPPSRWRRVRKITLIVLCMLTLSLFGLSVLGGNSDDLKEMLGTYLSESTGTTATIGTLNRVAFYPAMTFDAENIIFVRKGDAKTVTAEKMKFSIAFWSMIGGAARLRSLEVEGVSMDAGIYTPRDLTVEKAGIDAAQSVFILEGTYGGETVSLRFDLGSRTGLAGIPSYSLAKNSKISATLGPVDLKGVMNSSALTGTELDIQSLKIGKMPEISGKMVVAGGVSGSLKVGDVAYMLDIPVKEKDEMWVLRGSIAAEALSFTDIIGDHGLDEIYRVLQKFYFGPEIYAERRNDPYTLTRLDVDIGITAKDFTFIDGVSGPLAARATIADGILTLVPESQNMQGGVLGGRMVLDARENPGKFDILLHVADMDYTQAQNQVSAASDREGRVKIRLEAAGNGNNSDQIWSSLKGKLMLIAGEGEVGNAMVRLWGGGLARAMLPGLDSGERLRLNCGIGSFRIDGPQAKSEVVFLDTDSVTIAGEGNINLRKSTIDMHLDPETKNVTFLSVATSVDVEGSLKKPSVSPQGFSLMKKLGELFLGTINPAFLVFSMTDLGLAPSHPCREYIKE